MFRSIRTLIFPIAIIAIVVLPGVADAQGTRRSFDIAKFLKRLDTNKNGKVDPGEIKDDRTRSFLEKSGVDTSKPISIKSYAKKIKKKRDERNNPRSAQQSLGFAVDDDERDEESGSSLSFTVSDEERAPSKKSGKREFSEKTRQTLDWVMKSYDKNKDGKIDKNEIKSARWSQPPIEDSDTNKDGSLSRTELLVRYQKREDEKAKRDKDSDSRRSSRSRDRGSRDRDRGRDRGRDRDSSKTSSSTKSKATSENKAGNRDVRKGYESYVDGLFKSYDKNKDGFLDSEETENMRRAPDKKADANGDKKISKEELIDSYLAKAGQGRKSSRTSSDSSSKRRTSSRKSTSSSDHGNSRAPLTSKDKNKNGQLEMAEFVKDWSVDEIEEFNAIDTNNDRVITKAEWDVNK